LHENSIAHVETGNDLKEAQSKIVYDLSDFKKYLYGEEANVIYDRDDEEAAARMAKLEKGLFTGSAA